MDHPPGSEFSLDDTEGDQNAQAFADAVALEEAKVKGGGGGDGESINETVQADGEVEQSPSAMEFSDLETGEMPEAPRARWSSKFIFWMAMVGAAVGLANIWRFPYLVYKSGGGAFLVPYFVSLIFVGVPLMFLELAIGQWAQRGPVGAATKMSVFFVGVGWASAIASFIISTYYNIIMSWVLRYFVLSFQSPVPWANNTADYFNFEVIGAPPSLDIDDASHLTGWNVLGLFVCWVVVYFCIFKGVKSSGKAVMITVPLPYLLLFVMFFRGVTLSGAGEGIKFYLDPNFSKVFSDGTLWADAVSQVFFSTSIGAGVTIAFSSFNDRSQNIRTDALIVTIINSLTSILAGFVVFSTLGYLSEKTGKPIEDVVDHGPGLAFIAFPQVLEEMPATSFFSVMFFAMLLTLGIDSAFAMAEAVNTSLHELTDDPFKRKIITMGVCATGYVFGLLYCTDGGLYFFQIIDHFISHYLLIAVGIANCVLVGWVYGSARFIDELREMTGVNYSYAWGWMWRFVDPLILVAILVEEFVGDVREPFEGHPGWANAFGWTFAFCPILLMFVLGAMQLERFKPVRVVLMDAQVVSKTVLSSSNIIVLSLLGYYVPHAFGSASFMFTMNLISLFMVLIFLAIRLYDAHRGVPYARKMLVIETGVFLFVMVLMLVANIMVSVDLHNEEAIDTGRYLYALIFSWLQLAPAAVSTYRLLDVYKNGSK